MKFTNELAYFIRKETRNKTNIKNYDLLNDDFVFEATFKLDLSQKVDYNEFCVVGRTGYNMGIYAQTDKNGGAAIKWCWWELEHDLSMASKQLVVYKDIYMYPYDSNQKIKVKAVKEDSIFSLFINDNLFGFKEIGILYDYSDQTICVGVGNPYSESTPANWFVGDIYDVKIYHDSVESYDNLYLWYDFERNSHFKTFDQSGNGNHGEIFNSPELVRMKNEEFNLVARPAKII